MWFQHPKDWDSFALVGNRSLRITSRMHSPHAESVKAMDNVAIHCAIGEGQLYSEEFHIESESKQTVGSIFLV